MFGHGIAPGPCGATDIHSHVCGYPVGASLSRVGTGVLCSLTKLLRATPRAPRRRFPPGLQGFYERRRSRVVAAFKASRNRRQRPRDVRARPGHSRKGRHVCRSGGFLNRFRCRSLSKTTLSRSSCRYAAAQAVAQSLSRSCRHHEQHVTPGRRPSSHSVSFWTDQLFVERGALHGSKCI